jgi:release factor glutamine methyltransferase
VVPQSADVRELVKEATVAIAAAGSLTARLDAELLMAEVLGVGREALYREPERTPTAGEAERFAAFVARRETREPVAYIIGRRAFRTIALAVGPGALVPRPETETLVEVALEELARIDDEVDRELGTTVDPGRAAVTGMTGTDSGPPVAGTPGGARSPVPGGAPARMARPAPRMPRVLDMGTGSGAIALALVAEHPGVRVVGVDVDDRALEYARLNAARLELADRVEFLHSDMYEGLPGGARFDLIVANPPYLSAEELEQVQKEVRVYEPRHALVSGQTGLEAYEILIPGSLPFLEPGALLAVEVHEGRADEVAQIFRDTGRLGDVAVHSDLGGAPRVVSGREQL